MPSSRPRILKPIIVRPGFLYFGCSHRPSDYSPDHDSAGITPSKQLRSFSVKAVHYHQLQLCVRSSIHFCNYAYILQLLALS